jgi:hypothetical protein
LLPRAFRDDLAGRIEHDALAVPIVTQPTAAVLDGAVVPKSFPESLTETQEELALVGKHASLERLPAAVRFPVLELPLVDALALGVVLGDEPVRFAGDEIPNELGLAVDVVQRSQSMREVFQPLSGVFDLAVRPERHAFALALARYVVSAVDHVSVFTERNALAVRLVRLPFTFVDLAPRTVHEDGPNAVALV